jgi:acylphosphatase
VTTRFVVFGMVQGVGFRWFVARHARALGLRGYARNLENGSVEVVVDGRDESLSDLEHLLQAGPANAQVERVERTGDAVLTAAGQSFDIL